MSYDTAMDYGDAQDERPNAECSDCREPFVRAAIDRRELCDACCDQRDAWTDALELTMATAALRSDVVGVVEVAIVPVDPAAPLTPVLNVRLERAASADAVARPGAARAKRSLDIFASLPTLSAVQASKAYKPIPKKPIRRREVA